VHDPNPTLPIVADERGIASANWGVHELCTAFQPVFSLGGGRLQTIGHEALLRCYRNGRPVPLARFVAGIEPSARFAVEHIAHCLHITNAARCLPAPGIVFVNFDPSLLEAASAPERALSALAALARNLGVDTSRIVCEITEQESSGDAALDRFAIHARSEGMRIAVDDFGADSSDMRRVSQLRPDIVKFDQRWLWRLMDTKAGRDIIAYMAKEFVALGIETVFEGIEHAWQLDVAIACGADMLQGFALAHPALAGEGLPVAATLPVVDEGLRAVAG
jgi:EAL domain-containing protein (putative c-di-GMP-specific phosphodiesterase class I)